ncbi:hypothetical protein BHE74_00010199 [Ensete ventricosum]|nr:hypothetical protein GW17_00043088 [Ensete ventricosum]RWW81398.1 hypothetical protein BHE74_00010199 [Ensete ventricosum]
MASVDLIGAKLEAFEMRMEDRLRALFMEFRLDRSPRPRISQYGESFDHLRTNSKIQLILQVSHYKWKFREDDLAQIRPPDISTDEEVEVHMIITWDHRIMIDHYLNTTTTEIQDNARSQDHGVSTVDTTRKLQEELQTKTQSLWSLSLKDKADLKRAGLLGP